MSEIFITIALVCLVFSALWGLARRARRGCYPEPVSSHTPVPSMDVAAWHFSTRPAPVPVQQRLDASLKQALRSMSDESLRDFSPEAGDTQARRMRKLELDRRSRNKRRQAARQTNYDLYGACVDTIKNKAERDALFGQSWDANGSPT